MTVSDRSTNLKCPSCDFEGFLECSERPMDISKDFDLKMKCPSCNKSFTALIRIKAHARP
jgi:uncharacterized C2H2 Zn-finger protein